MRARLRTRVHGCEQANGFFMFMTIQYNEEEDKEKILAKQKVVCKHINSTSRNDTNQCWTIKTIIGAIKKAQIHGAKLTNKQTTNKETYVKISNCIDWNEK